MKKAKGFRVAVALLTAAGMMMPGTVVGAAQTKSTVSSASTATESKSTEELQAQIDQLTKERDELKAKVDELTKEVEKLKNGGGESTAASTVSLPENVANADTTVTYSDAATVRLVQQALNAAGFNCGTPDGVAGTNTSAQISAYETAKGLTVNGAITDQLLQSLGIADQVADQAKKEAQKGQYSSDFTYEQLARNPDSYVGQKVKFSGEVAQVENNGADSYIRLAANSDYDTIFLVAFDSDSLGYNILDDDKVTVYGTAQGVISYTSIWNQKITIPAIQADTIEENS